MVDADCYFGRRNVEITLFWHLPHLCSLYVRSRELLG